MPFLPPDQQRQSTEGMCLEAKRKLIGTATSCVVYTTAVLNDRTQISAVLNFFDGYIQIWFLCVRMCVCVCVCILVLCFFCVSLDYFVVCSESVVLRFYRAMLCIRGTSHGPVSVYLCLSQVGVLLKRQNVGSHKQHHTIPQGF